MKELVVQPSTSQLEFHKFKVSIYGTALGLLDILFDLVLDVHNIVKDHKSPQTLRGCFYLLH